MNYSKLSIFKNILFWIIVFFILRLFAITNAPVEMGHSWRQVLTNMVSRNMLEIEPSLMYPRIDMGGERTGIIGAEFPVYNYLIYMWFKLFGVNHWIGRLINLVISSIGIYFFHQIISKYISRKVAFNATIVLLVSGWFGFSRKVMPDTVSVSFAIIGLYYALRFIEKEKIINLIQFVIFAGLGVLIKMPAVIILSVLILPLFSSKYSIGAKLKLTGAGGIVLLLMGLWYFYWVPHLTSTYGYVLYYPRSLVEGLNQLWVNLFDTLDKFFFAALLSFVAFGFFIFGLFMIFKKKQSIIKYSLLVTSVILFFYMMKTGDVFSFHSYYIIPFTPVMALVAGYGISFLPIRWSYLVLVVITIESIANQSHDFVLKPDRILMLEWEELADEVSDSDDKVIVSGHLDPSTMYFVHRKGWSVENKVLSDTASLWELHRKGAQFVFVNRTQYDHDIKLNLIKRTKFLDVYDFKDHN